MVCSYRCRFNQKRYPRQQRLEKLREVLALSLAKIGAGLYVIWGLLHIDAAYEAFAQGLALSPGAVQGKIYQDAWNLLFFAPVFSIVVATRHNWKNNKTGYWLNIIVVSAADIGFLIFILIPATSRFSQEFLGLSFG
jgi:hypothetical protein